MKWILLLLMLFGSTAFAQDPNEDPTEIYVDGGGSAAGDLKLDVGEKLIFDDDQEEDDYIFVGVNDTVIHRAGNTLVLKLGSTYVDFRTRIYNSTAVLSLGSAGTTSHELVTGDVIFGAGAAVEFDDVAWFDQQINVNFALSIKDDIVAAWGSSNDVRAYWPTTAQDNDALMIGIESGSAEQSGDIIITEGTNLTKNHHMNLNTEVQLCIFDANTDPNNDATAYGCQYHDGTDYVAGIGKGDYRFNSSNGKSSASYIRTKTESVTFAGDPGDASKVTTGSVIPAGAFVVGVSGRVTTANTGGCTSIDIGIAAKDTDAFADGIAVAATTTFTTSDGNSAADYSATSLGIIPSIAAQEITVTAVGGDGACDDMVVALTVHYMGVSAATAN